MGHLLLCELPEIQGPATYIRANWYACIESDAISFCRIGHLSYFNLSLLVLCTCTGVTRCLDPRKMLLESQNQHYFEEEPLLLMAKSWAIWVLKGAGRGFVRRKGSAHTGPT